MSLSKSSPTISLEKKGGTLGEIKINLDWNQGEPKKGLFGLTKSGGIDLDLCCLYELADGTRLGIQALGKNFGEFERPPYIQLAGDDRTGSVRGGEWMRINGERWGEIRRVLVYAMIYEGVPNWSATDGVVTLYAPGNPEVEVRMEGTSDERLCAVTLLENDGGNLKVTRENRYFKTRHRTWMATTASNYRGRRGASRRLAPPARPSTPLDGSRATPPARPHRSVTPEVPWRYRPPDPPAAGGHVARRAPRTSGHDA